MPLLERTRAGDAEVAGRLAGEYAGRTPEDVLRAAIGDFFPGRIALVSSFGADSAVLLHMVAQIDASLPVVFVDTGHLFAETLAYRDRLIARLGLRDCRTIHPDASELAATDPETFLWAANSDACCKLRKVVPLARALQGFEAWISGRKRYQATTRQSLDLFEADGQRTKVNPLAEWSAVDVHAYLDAWDLPQHELVARNYPSIGCMPCTSSVRPGEDARAGRWRGKGKVECGIHTDFIEAGAGI